MSRLFLRSLAAATRPVQRRAAAALVGGAAVAFYSIDSDVLADAKSVIAGLRVDAVERYTVQLDAAPAAAAEDTVVDAATGVAHANQLLPASAPALALVGVGVRTVSFVHMKVYSAGFYVDTYTLKRLPTLPGWKGYTAADLRGPEAEERVQAVLDTPAAVAVNVIPVRNTDFAHLRDGLTRTLVGRIKMGRHRGEVTPADEEVIADAMQQFKAVFPGGSVPKGKSLTLVRAGDGFLSVEYEGRVLGKVANEWVANNLIKAYFNAASPISPALRDSVAEGLEKYV
ncbi:hypothetical protein CspeluHIS016_0702390 [Cutaneotrichosporon spelunceum]|uniref:Chalcone isomerase domain-containing protein n=1 Tax=Cutaneotrichosporon spelunceum TaxID=1672016 RepID=A0AAD3TZ61_9TREE|nr:hypothetical protein CspeluHIS016_0702390 [Cutaneotrichosporon spelunceum]